MCSVSIGPDLGAALTTRDKAAITSATTLGALLGGLAAGALSDYTGRKSVLSLANVVFIAGALVQAAARSVGPMIVGRLVVGLGVGLASCVAPLYIGELAPTRQRGRLVTINAVACTLGQVAAYGMWEEEVAPRVSGWMWGGC
jgi:SP family myo-inositol transporter-like MFS transporter 13